MPLEYSSLGSALGSLAGTIPALAQKDWFISAAGSNNADGATAGTPTNEAERQRRWGIVSRLAPNTAYTVTYQDSPADQVNYLLHTAPGSSLLIQGTRTQTKAGALTAVTAINRGAQTPWSVTEGTLGAGDVGRIMRITAGARVGNYARIVKDNGAGNVRTTPFGKLAYSFFDPDPQVTPVAADAFQVVTMPTLNIGTAWFTQGSNEAPSSPPLAGAIQFDSLNLNGGAGVQGVLNSENIQIFLSQCICSNLGFAGPGGLFSIAGGGCDGACFLVSGPVLTLSGCSIMSGQFTVYPGGYLNIDGDTIIQGGAGGALFVLPGGVVDGGLVSAFDCANNLGILLAPRATYRSTTLGKGADLLWGTANTGHGVRLLSGAGLFYITKPTINGGLGAGREALVGGTDKLWGAIPFNDSGAAASSAVIAATA